VRPDPRAQPPGLGHQLLACHRFEVFVHEPSFRNRGERPVMRGVGRT